MAEKGDKVQMEPLCKYLYSQRPNLAHVSQMTGVSRQTLTKWKAATKVPGEDLDEWDKAAQRKGTDAARIATLFDRELTCAEDKPAGSVDQATLNSINILGSLVQRFKAAEREQVMKSGEYKAAMFLEFLRDLISFFGKQDTSVVQIIEGNFDDLIQWGREKYGTA